MNVDLAADVAGIICMIVVSVKIVLAVRKVMLYMSEQFYFTGKRRGFMERVRMMDERKWL
jgi:hypothetical protein